MVSSFYVVLLTLVTVCSLFIGGHFDVVKLLVEAGADVDSQDNRKVFCLMAAFRKVHTHSTVLHKQHIPSLCVGPC